MPMMLLDEVLPEEMRMATYAHEMILGESINAELSGKRFVWSEYFCANYECKCKMVSVRLTEINDDYICFGKSLAVLCCEWFGIGGEYSITLDNEFEQSIYAPGILELY